jgi:hypothetical protein
MAAFIAEYGRPGRNNGDWLDHSANVAAGWGGALTFGGTTMIGEAAGIYDGINPDSTAYQIGDTIGTVHQAAIIGAVTGGVGTEVASAVIEKATGIPVIVNPLDLVQSGTRSVDDIAGAAGRSGPACACNNPGGRLCFVAGTEVVLAHSLAEAVTTNADVLAMPEQSGPGNNLLMTTVLLVCAAQVAVRNARRKSDEDQPILEDESDTDKCVVAAAPSGVPCGTGEASFCSERGAGESYIRGAVIADLTRNYDLTASPAPPRTVARYATSGMDRLLLSKFAAWACLSACLVVATLLSFSRRDPEPNAPPSLARTTIQQQATAPIETVRVGQRVVTMVEGGHDQTSVETSVNPATWRHLRLQAVDVWPDGTRDVIEVETLQPAEWIAEHGAHVGAEVTLPLDLQEMGLREDIKALVIANEPCPDLPAGSGRVVLTTVSHLNNDVWQLDVVDSQGESQQIRPTGLHKFYSATRDAWVSAMDLEQGEKLRGINGAVEVRSLVRLGGVHRVYNMTVEGSTSTECPLPVFWCITRVAGGVIRGSAHRVSGVRCIKTFPMCLLATLVQAQVIGDSIQHQDSAVSTQNIAATKT